MTTNREQQRTLRMSKYTSFGRHWPFTTPHIFIVDRSHLSDPVSRYVKGRSCLKRHTRERLRPIPTELAPKQRDNISFGAIVTRQVAVGGLRSFFYFKEVLVTRKYQLVNQSKKKRESETWSVTFAERDNAPPPPNRLLLLLSARFASQNVYQ